LLVLSLAATTHRYTQPTLASAALDSVASAGHLPPTLFYPLREAPPTHRGLINKPAHFPVDSPSPIYLTTSTKQPFNMFSKLLIPFALTASVLAHAAPPNPDQLFALQEAAASKASVASASSEATSTPAAAAKHHAGSKHAPGHREKRGDDWTPLKRHQHGQQMHGTGLGMQRKRVAKRNGTQRMDKQEVVREKRRRDSGLDSSQVKEEDDSDLEARGTQYTLYEDTNTWSADSNTWSADTNTWSEKASAKASATSSSKAATSTSSSSSSDLSGYWHGASSYYLTPWSTASATPFSTLSRMEDSRSSASSSPTSEPTTK